MERRGWGMPDETKTGFKISGNSFYEEMNPSLLKQCVLCREQNHKMQTSGALESLPRSPENFSWKPLKEMTRKLCQDSTDCVGDHNRFLPKSVRAVNCFGSTIFHLNVSLLSLLSLLAMYKKMTGGSKWSFFLFNIFYGVQSMLSKSLSVRCCTNLNHKDFPKETLNLPP